MRALIAVAIFILSLPTAVAHEYSEPALKGKKYGERMERESLSEPFTGITQSTGIEKDLFPLKQTGISTLELRKSAEAFLASLSSSQLLRTQFAIDSDEWRKWVNVDNAIYSRQGTSLAEMSPETKQFALDLLRTSLSLKGYKLSLDIMKTDTTLSEINNDAFYLDEDLYYLTIMGKPHESNPWGWQLEGHHLVINYFILGDQVVMTPSFWGAEPAVTKSGKHTGNVVLQDEQDEGLAFMNSLPAEQQTLARIKESKVSDDLVAGAFQDNLTLDYTGLRASSLSDLNKQKLLDLIGIYIANLKDEHAKLKMADIEKHLDDTWFAWIGDTTPDSVFYYRIHSPVVLIEFDHQRPVGTRRLNPSKVPVRDHIHIVVRTPNGNDYGKDLLRQHLQQHKH